MDQNLPCRKFQPEKRLSKVLGDLFRVKIRLKWAIIPFFRCSKILGQAGKQENFRTNPPKILDLKSSSEQIFSENCRWVPLKTFVRYLQGYPWLAAVMAAILVNRTIAKTSFGNLALFLCKTPGTFFVCFVHQQVNTNFHPTN